MFKYLFVFLLLGNYCLSTSNIPVKGDEFKKVLRTFSKPFRNKAPSQTLEAPLTLHLTDWSQSFSMTDTTYRRTRLEINQVSAERENYSTNVGHIILIENNINPGIDGKFSLHFINILEDYRKKGLGGKALDLVITFAERLAKQSTFYNILSLQCSDYDGDTFLGNLPHRLTIYLNRGFQIDPLTLNYMRYLDLSTFVHSMKTSKFIKFLRDYDCENSETHNYSLSSRIPEAETILGRLKEIYSLDQKSTSDDLTCKAESSSSDYGMVILDRLYYSSEIHSKEYKNSGEYIYLMHLNVLKRQEALRQRQQVLDDRKGNKVTPYNPDELNDFLGTICKVHDKILEEKEEASITVVTQLSTDKRVKKARKVSVK